MTPAARPARRGDGERRAGERRRRSTRDAPGPAPRADRTRPAAPTSRALLGAHVDRLAAALPALHAAAPTLARWGEDLGQRLLAGNRLLAAGNGGSAAEAQHLTAELVGRFDGDRRPLSAIALHADTSSLSAIGNDYGFAQVYARQVRAHARPGDVLLMFSTSGRSQNLRGGRDRRGGAGRDVLGGHRARPQPAGGCCDDAVCLPGRHRDGAGDAPRRPAHAVPGGRAGGGRRPAGPGRGMPVDRPRVVVS